jgi:hypothetical protein
MYARCGYDRSIDRISQCNAQRSNFEGDLVTQWKNSESGFAWSSSKNSPRAA